MGKYARKATREQLDARRSTWKAICARARLALAKSAAWTQDRELTPAEIERITAGGRPRKARKSKPATKPHQQRPPQPLRLPKRKRPVTWR